MTEVAKKAEEERAKKRKSKSGHDSSSAKKAKIDKTFDKGKDNKKQITLTGSPFKQKVTSPVSSPTTSPTQVPGLSTGQFQNSKKEFTH